MSGREELWVEGVNGVRIAADLVRGVAGIEPGFLLVHGLASNARLWDGVARELAVSGCPSVAVDLRGHGRSDKPDEGYDYETLCADLRAVMAAFTASTRVTAVVAVGQSFGGNLVLELAAREPEGLVGVACVDGGIFDLASRFKTWEEVVTSLSPPVLSGMPAKKLRAGMRAAHPDWPEEGIDGSMANFEVRPDGTVTAWLSLDHHLAILRAMWSSRPSDIYGRIRVPVLFMPAASPGAEAWTEEKKAGVAAALAALPDASVQWFSPADHDIHAQFPAEVAAALLDRFGAGLPRGT